MKRVVFLIIVCVICITTIGTISYNFGLKNAPVKTENIVVEDSIGKIDYPLIDIAFNDGNEYTVFIINGIYSDNRTYLLCHDGKDLQFDKEYLSVFTYPAGRGTTGNGSIVVFRNGEAIREIEFFEIFFNNEELRNKFKKVSEKEFEKFKNDTK